jgi:hypothetical protein
VRYWKKYKSIVLVPPREEKRKELIRKIQKALGVNDLSGLSGSTLFGVLNVSITGEQVKFEVAVKVYTWLIAKGGREAGLELVFVVVGDNCLECMMRVWNAVNMFGEEKGVLTLSIPGGEND